MITTEELVKKVRRLVNEAEDDASVTLISEDSRSFDDTIMALLPQAVSFVQKNSHGGYVNVRVIPPGNLTITVFDDCPSLFLPDDFVRLVSFQLKGWRMPCTLLSSPDSLEAIYILNQKPTEGAFRPVCIEGVSNTGERIMKLFPAEYTTAVQHFVYEAQFNVAEGLNMCDSCMVDAVAYACAALLYNVFERYDSAKLFFSLALTLCGFGDNVKL